MKLTPFAKVFIALVIVGVVGYVATTRDRHLQPLPPKETPDPRRSGPSSDNRIVIGVNDFGGAYPLLLANDGPLPSQQSLFTKAGLEVEIRLIRGSKERLAAFESGEVQVMLLTLDYVANLAPVFKEKGIDIQSFLFVDWSRGNIGIAAKPEFPSIESLLKAKIATTKNTPTHYLLMSLLDKSNLTPPQIEQVKSSLVFATKTPQAAELFMRGEVDAVALWEPHLSHALAGGKGQVLLTTETATNLIADVLFARKEYLESHRAELGKLAQAYFEAVAQLGTQKERTVSLAAAAFQQQPAEVAATLAKIKPATFADNRSFFGLATEDCAHDQLLLEATRFWQKEGLLKPGQAVEPARAKWLRALEDIAPQYKDQRVVEGFKFTAAPEKAAPSLLTKSVSIYFASGKSDLDMNAKRVLDGFATTLQVFQNAYVGIEGNTDNVGNRAANVALSKVRAQAVQTYLVERHRLEPTRFLVTGNGPDVPVADNKTPEGRELNRRTDFKILKNASAAAP